MSLLIGLGYKARQGKDTVAAAIIEARGAEFDVRRYAFADELKREYTEACEKAGSAYELIQQMRVTHNLPDWVQYEFGADMDDPMCPYGKQRTLLQWWGTEYRRMVDPFYWVKKLKVRIAEEQPNVALITDMRFPNEAFFVKVNGGYTIEVSREGFGGIASNSHPSEHALAGYAFDIRIAVEEGNLAQLKQDAVEVFDMIRAWNTHVPIPENAEVTDEQEG